MDDDEISNYVTEKQIMLSGKVKKLAVKLNGQEAANYLLENVDGYPDLVLLDINMPIMNGFELLDLCKSSGLEGKIKFVMFTTSTHQNDKISAMKYDDVIDYIEKPITDSKLDKILKKL